MRYILRASAKTVHWGYYDSRLEPVLRHKSGDTVEVYTASGAPDVIECLGIRNEIPKELEEIYQKAERGSLPHFLGFRTADSLD